MQAPALVQASAPEVQPFGQVNVPHEVLSHVALQAQALLQRTLSSHELPVQLMSQVPEPHETSPVQELPEQAMSQSSELAQLTLLLHDAPEQATLQAPAPQVMLSWHEPLLQVMLQSPVPQNILSAQLPEPEQVTSQGWLPQVTFFLQLLAPVQAMSQAAPLHEMSPPQLPLALQVI